MTFMANAEEAMVNGASEQTEKDQYKIPSFSGYVPTHEGGYTFGG